MENGPALIDGSSPRPSGRRFGSGEPVAPCDVRLNLSADAEQVVLVRSVVGALAVALGFPDRSIHDVRLAVTEACTNVVRHAYPGPPTAPGRLDVAARATSGALTVTVADQGIGLRPRMATGPGGLGLPLMAALAESVEFEDTPGKGTTVRLSFAAAE